MSLQLVSSQQPTKVLVVAQYSELPQVTGLSVNGQYENVQLVGRSY